MARNVCPVVTFALSVFRELGRALEKIKPRGALDRRKVSAGITQREDGAAYSRGAVTDFPVCNFVYVKSCDGN